MLRTFTRVTTVHRQIATRSMLCGQACVPWCMKKTERQSFSTSTRSTVSDVSFNALASTFRCSNDMPLPKFPVAADSVHIIDNPTAFYELLQERVASSNDRIHLSSLYIGTDDMSKKLLQQIDERCNESPSMNVSFTLDKARAERLTGGEHGDEHSGGQTSCVDLISPLISRHPNRISLHLFNAPINSAHSMVDRLLSLFAGDRGRAREALCVHHMKLYVFDNSVIISGANLSESYFTNRQDRYILIENNPTLANYCVDLLSFLQNSMYCDNEKKIEKHNSAQFRQELQSYLQIKYAQQSSISENKNDDTWIYPTIQIPGAGVSQDSELTEILLKSQRDSCFISLASGYFNLVPQYMHTLAKAFNPVTVLSASEQANGFYGGRGVVGMVPSFYTALLPKEKDAGSLHVVLYNRDGWTFHAKGVWLLSKNEEEVATMVGSPNFGYRSVLRDTELSFLCVSSNEILKNKLQKELDGLSKYCQVQNVQSEEPSFIEKSMSKLVKTFL